MKKIIQLIIIVAIIIIVVVKTPLLSRAEGIIYSSPCDSPIDYRVGFVDPQFHVSKKEFLTAIQQAEYIWEKNIGKNVFQYNEKENALSINLVFDERQSLTNKITSLEGKLKNQKNTIDPQIAQYEQRAAQFKQRVAALNEEVARWNSQGGAPQDDYNRLKKEQQDLEQEAASLNILARSLNRSKDVYNAQVGQLNNTVDTFNAALTDRPEEGLYDPKNNRILIYFDVSHDELVHTLAHELGHALGLNHNTNKSSIMYPKTTTSLTVSSEELTELQKICEKRTIFDRIGNIITLLSTKNEHAGHKE